MNVEVVETMYSIKTNRNINIYIIFYFYVENVEIYTKQ